MYTFSRPTGRFLEGKQVSGHVKWSSPSNIAIVKYWGKHGRQLPKNASISFTLSDAKTTTEIKYKSKESSSSGIAMRFTFEGKENIAFRDKLVKYFESIVSDMPFLEQLEFEISSSNSFPHSAGIASSASAMSAIACCLCDIEQAVLQSDDRSIDRMRASYIARLGSGSACRSLYPVMSVWGATENVYLPDEVLFGATDLIGLEYEHGVSAIFKTYHDDILIVSKKEKSVSSTAGHQLMENNVYAEARYRQAEDRMQDVLVAIKMGDQKAFGKIAEDEALTLHALMMSSDPSYLLMHPNTLSVIEKVRDFRMKTGLNLYFTLDAGPNVHLLYPDNEKLPIQEFIDSLLQYCEEGMVIRDRVGQGPVKLQ